MTDADLRLIFDALPGVYLILKPNASFFTIVYFNRARARITLTSKSVIGKNLFDTFPSDPDNYQAATLANLRESLMTVVRTKMPHTMALQRYDLYHPELQAYEERYWLPTNTPVLDEQGEILYIIHSVEDMTARVLLEQKEKQAQEDLRHLYQAHSKILESIADGFISVDRNWKVNYWNQQAEKIFNVDRSQVLGKNLWALLRKVSDNEIRKSLQDVMHKKRPAHFEQYYGTVWLQVNAYPSEEGMVVFFLDITERRTAEEIMRSNERRFQALMENISDGLTLISPDGTVLEGSASGRRILGYEEDVFKGRNREDLIHPDDLPKVHEAIEAVLQHPAATYTLEYRFKTARGAYKWLEGTFHNLLHEKKIEAIVLTFRDISQRRQYEEQLRASEEKFRYLFYNSPATIIIWTLDDLRIREVNETAVNLFGYSRSQMLRMNSLELRALEERERLLHLAVEFKRQDHPVSSGIWKVVNNRGETLFLNISFHKITYGNQDAVLSLGTNVTEKVKLENKLEEERLRKQREITEAVLTAQENERAELGRELHDNINQILTTTRLYMEHAMTRIEKREELLNSSLEYIGKAIDEIRRLSRTLMPPYLGMVSLKQSLEELLRNTNLVKEIRFSYELSPEDEDRLGNPVKLAIFRIIQEQLTNIYKHAQATLAEVRLLRVDGWVKLFVKDNGNGFGPRKGGQGMGLRNITSRANLLGGQVNLESEVGRGTELQVSFPI